MSKKIKKLCRYFLESGGNCPHGNNCYFLHQFDIPMSGPSIPSKNPHHDTACWYFLNNTCNKNNKCEYFHGYCDRLQYVKTIGNHQNEINNLVNMDEIKFISSDNSTFYVRFSGNDQFHRENINEDFKFGKLIFSSNKVICAIQKSGM